MGMGGGNFVYSVSYSVLLGGVAISTLEGYHN